MFNWILYPYSLVYHSKFPDHIVKVLRPSAIPRPRDVKWVRGREPWLVYMLGELCLNNNNNNMETFFTSFLAVYVHVLNDFCR